MKILEDYKKIAHELLFEVDDEKMIKYKDKDGESKEMKAGSAKTMPADHPAKQAWDKMSAQDGDDDSGAEKEKGQKIGGSDFDRDAQNQKVTGKYGGESSKSGKPWKELEGDDTLKHLNKKDLNLTMQFMKGLPKFFTYGKLNNLGADDKGDIYYSNQKGIGAWKVSQVGDDTTLDDLRADIKKNVPLALKGKLGRTTDFGKDDRPVGAGADDGEKSKAGDFEVDTDPKKYAGLESYEASMAKTADKEIALHGKFGDGSTLPPGTDFRTKIDDLDEEEVEAFYDEVADKYAKKHDITIGVLDDNKNYFMDEEGMTMSDLVSGIKSSAEEAEAEGGYMKYGESIEPKNKPFLKEQLERFGGGHK